jgi:hypothetical protein
MVLQRDLFNRAGPHPAIDFAAWSDSSQRIGPALPCSLSAPAVVHVEPLLMEFDENIKRRHRLSSHQEADH